MVAVRAVAVAKLVGAALAIKSSDIVRQEVRFRIMRLIEANPTYSQRDIAKALGISLGAVNYCINALVEVGFVKIRNFRAADRKLRYAYILTPQGALQKASLTSGFLQRKLREYEALKSEIELLQVEAAIALARASEKRK